MAGFDDIVHPTRSVTPVDVLRRAVVRDKDDRNIPPDRIPLETPAEFVPVHALHGGIDEKKIGDHGLENFQSVLAASGTEHFIALFAEGAGVNPQILDGFIDDQDLGISRDQV